MPTIVFTARLTEADWDDTMRAWRCPPLAVPGAIVEALYIEGSRVDSARYEVLSAQAVIRWIPPDQPPRAAATIRLTEELTLAAQTDRWKKLAIILPVAATILSAAISGVATYYSKPALEGQSSIRTSTTTNASTPPPGEASSGKATYSKPAPDDQSSDRASITANGSTPPPGETNSAPATGNTHITRVKALTLGQTEKGIATSEPHWFKFSTSSRSPNSVHILARNPNLSGGLEAQAFGPDELMVKNNSELGQNIVLEFSSSHSATYYIMIREWITNKGVPYELVVTEQ